MHKTSFCILIIIQLLGYMPQVCNAGEASKDAEIVCHVEWAVMRDDKLLASDVYHPAGESRPLPTILFRSPYNASYTIDSESGCIKGTVFDSYFKALVTAGYVVINQDVRGTSRSQGSMQPFIQEKNDGYDAVEWAALQRWSNGKVGLSGASYLGATAMLAAASDPPHLVAVESMITGSDYHDNWVYDNGVLNLWFLQQWISSSFAFDSYRRDLLAEGIDRAKADKQAREWSTNLLESISSRNNVHLPPSSFPDFKGKADYYYDWLTRPTYDTFWFQIDLEKQYSAITVPVLNIGGWYDIFSMGTIRNFMGLRKSGGTSLARENATLVMKPLCHLNCDDNAISFGEHRLFDIPTSLSWWNYWLKEDKTEAARETVSLFVMNPPDEGRQGGGYWLFADEYPLKDSKVVQFNLSSNGKANTLNGDGLLDYNIPSSGVPDRFVYDPKNPVPTLGGNLCCEKNLFPAGGVNQSEIELREDVLVYTSSPLKKDYVVVGPVKVVFWAVSSARDTNFTAKLVDAYPNSFAQNVLDRIVRSRYRNGSKNPPSQIEAGKPYKYTIELGNTAHVFPKGHSIRLEISSSNYPRYALNPNVEELMDSYDNPLTVMQTILHDKAYPSFLELPVVDRYIGDN